MGGGLTLDQMGHLGLQQDGPRFLSRSGSGLGGNTGRQDEQRAKAMEIDGGLRSHRLHQRQGKPGQEPACTHTCSPGTHIKSLLDLEVPAVTGYVTGSVTSLSEPRSYHP